MMLTDVRKFLGNLFALYSVQVTNILIPIVTFPYLVRTLGVDAFGTVTYVMSWMQVGIAFVGLGYQYTATLETTQLRHERNSLSELLISVTLLKLFVAGAFCLVLIPIALTDPILKQQPEVVVATIPLIVGDALFPGWYLLGLERMRWIALTGISGRIIGAILLFVLVRKESDIVLAAFCQSIPVFIAGVLALSWIKKKDELVFVRPGVEQSRARFFDALKAFGTSLPGHIYSRGQFIVLGQLVSVEEIGIYAIAQRITGIFSTIMAPIAEVLYPRVCALMSAREWSRIKKMHSLSVLGAVLSGVAITLLLWLLGHHVIRLIVGAPQEHAYEVLFVMAPIVGLIGASVLQRPFIMAQKSYQPLFFVSALGSTAFVLFSFPLTLEWNLYGMVYTMVLVESVIALGMLFLTFRIRKVFWTRSEQ